MLSRGTVRGVDLAVIVAAAAQSGQLVVGEVLDQTAQSRVGPEEVLADVRAAGLPSTSWNSPSTVSFILLTSRPSTSRASRSSHSRPQISLDDVLQPAPRKRPSEFPG